MRKLVSILKYSFLLIIISLLAISRPNQAQPLHSVLFTGEVFASQSDDGKVYNLDIKRLEKVQDQVNNLNTIILGCETWFPQLRDRRDDIVHRYETYFIVFGQNSEGEKTAQQFSPRKNTPAKADEDLRSYIGMVTVAVVPVTPVGCHSRLVLGLYLK